MKVVINTCFGGFSLSPLGEQEYLKRKGKQAFFYIQSKYRWDSGKNEYRRVSLEEATKSFLTFTMTKDLGEVISEFPKDEDEIYFSSRDIERHDPDLVAIVEEFNSKHREGINGQCAELSAIEIPDGTSYQIEEYDGSEHIAETHRTWR